MSNNDQPKDDSKNVDHLDEAKKIAEQEKHKQGTRSLVMLLIGLTIIVFTVFLILKHSGISDTNRQLAMSVIESMELIISETDELASQYASTDNELSNKLNNIGILLSGEKKKIMMVRDSPVPMLSEATVYVLALVILSVFGIFVALYRFHAKERIRQQGYELAFYRIWIASKSGFPDDTVRVLNQGAFNLVLPEGRGKPESPVPGMVASDAATLLAHAIRETVTQAMRASKRDDR